MSESLSDIFRQTVKAFGSRPAIVGRDKIMSYTELDSRSEEVATVLQGMRIGPAARIGIFRRKDVDTVASFYGVLKAGFTYVPIDTRMGPDRLAAVLNDAGLAALIVEPLLMPRLQALIAGGLCPWLADATTHGDILRFPSGAGSALSSCSPVSADSTPAYILYTSGSTGQPKGVQHTHASALAFISWAAAEFDISSRDRLSCHAPFHFDLTIFDLFAAAMTGACTVLIPDEFAMFPLQVASLIEAERITVWYSVPFALIQLVKHGNLQGRHLSLRQVIFAGERFPPTQLRQLAALLPKVRLTNLFGPTETNVCTYHHLSQADAASDEFCPIGRPCPYASIAIVDKGGNKIAPGEMGELLVGGASVMTGYLNRPEMNEQAFITEEKDGKADRFFRTGDLVTAPEGGPMHFHGRIDRQVKVRGFRIELDEIEAALANCAGVVAAAAWVDKDSNGFAEIRAAVATEPASTTLDSNDLIAQIRSHLHQAAVPARILVMKDMPRSINGKVDYAALAELAR
ncbi:MAG: amino acid adenylation domain-containing protein [Blastocatellia bacterium]|nr:amino acid adenylation domain-containing protein [Blastocatellia bacterium]